MENINRITQFAAQNEIECDINAFEVIEKLEAAKLET